MAALRTVEIIRYITPLREGGSRPAIVEADDEFKYVLKFRGAGQGVKALIAELIGGELARVLDIKIPELVFAQVDPAFGRSEPDEVIQDLLKASAGLNLALHYLSGAITFDATVNKVDPFLASRIIWLDSLITNVDRTARNTNMLMWHGELWLIDHGASLYFHHSWDNWQEHSQKPFAAIKDHVLLPSATQIEEANAYCLERITPEVIASITALIPNEWLVFENAPDAAANRKVYEQYLINRLHNSSQIVKTAQDAR